MPATRPPVPPDPTRIRQLQQHAPRPERIPGGADGQTGSPTRPSRALRPATTATIFVGIGEINDIQDALQNIYFQHNAPNDSCDLTVIVSDLGNNGMPLQYFSDPDYRQYGVETSVLRIRLADLHDHDRALSRPSTSASSIRRRPCWSTRARSATPSSRSRRSSTRPSSSNGHRSTDRRRRRTTFSPRILWCSCPRTRTRCRSSR